MRILLTGATGFLGSYLAKALVARGHDVAVLRRREADPWRLADILDKVQQIDGGFDDLAAIRPALEGFRPEAAAHLGWRGVGNIDRDNPVQAQNIVDAVQLARLCAELGVASFIGAGSQAEYGPYPRAIEEDDAARPTTLYGHAKLCAGTMVAHMARQAGMRFAWLRVFSTYGPKDADTWLIPSLIKTLRAGRRMALTGCEQRWGFLHARDAAAAFCLALENPQASGILNLGADDAPPLKNTVMALRDLVNPSAELGFGDIPYRPDQVMILQAGISKLAKLGWKPQIDLQTGLRETAAWYVEQP